MSLLACLPAPSASSQRVQWVIAGCTYCVSHCQLARYAYRRGHIRSSNDRVLLLPKLRDSLRLMARRCFLRPIFQCSLRLQSGTGSCSLPHSFAVIVVGGVTRLTGSWLSITKWWPITGFLPPLSQTEWKCEIDKYSVTPEFRLCAFVFHPVWLLLTHAKISNNKHRLNS